VLEPDARYPLKLQELSCLKPAVAGKDGAVLVDEEGSGEAKLADTVGNLPNLLS